MRVSRRLLPVVVAVCAVHAPLIGQTVHPVPSPEVRAVPLGNQLIKLDGKLDEEIWHTAPVASDLRQSRPHEGQPATQRTEVRFAFDDAYLYVGARMYDDSGARGVRTRLVRRDDTFNSDYLEVIFDTYHDHIGRLYFMTNPSGVKYDANGLGGGEDPSWDPIWDVKTSIDSLGWTAEMRIPFSQLRYPNTRDEQTWGLQIWRQENRLNELSQWAFWTLQESGGPMRFGHLRGIVVNHAPGRAEVLPYVVGRSNNTPVDNPLDPYEAAHKVDDRIGGDARVLLTSNLTLNATVNPDFGQVEVDPAVVNLTAFETFFDEKRPFFVEGAGYFNFGGLNCYFCSNVSSLSTFYSRRIGRAPSMTGNAYDQGTFADVPDNTSILGAAKLTGRTQSGWSIGVLDAVTGRAQARTLRVDTLRDSSTQAIIAQDTVRGRATVEPPANYFVGRIARDFRGGATQWRMIATSVVRGLGADTFLQTHMNTHSEALGVGTDMYWGRRDYHLMWQLVGTQVSGDTADNRRLQQSSARYDQRPDRSRLSNGLLTNAYDSTLTALRGLGMYSRFARETGKWLWEVSTNMRTPGFENNDIAALQRADYWFMSGNVLRQWTTPSRWYRFLTVIGGGQQSYNFSGDLVDRQEQLFASMTLLNYWNLNGFIIHRPRRYDDQLERGGPVIQRQRLDIISGGITSDSRKRIILNLSGEYYCNEEGYCSHDESASIEMHPRPNVAITIGPSFSRSFNGIQYVQTVADPTASNFFGNRYVFADIDQRTLSMSTRLNVTFSPTLTFDLYVQPLVASGQYSRFNQFASPRSTRQLRYGVDIGTISRSAVPNGSAGDSTITYTVDPDGLGPAPSFTIDNPDFTFRSLRGNAVLRWEFRPGSTLFVVWTRSSSSTLSRGELDLGSDASAVFRGPSQNIFLVKMTYHVGL